MAAAEAEWTSVAECLETLLRTSDPGSSVCMEAYQYLYHSLEEVAHEEETPPELQCLLPEQAPAVVKHIMAGLQRACVAPLEFAEQAAIGLPLLTMLLHDGRCCKRLVDDGRADQQVLGLLLDIARRAQEQLTDPTILGPDGRGGAHSVKLISLADLAFHVLDTCAYQHCNLSTLSEDVLLNMMTVLRMAVAGEFGPIVPLMPPQGLRTALKLLPRLAPNPGCAGEARLLLKAILRRALSGYNAAGDNQVNQYEIKLAEKVLALTQLNRLLARDPPAGPVPGDGDYCAFVREHFQEDRFKVLAKANLELALRLVACMLPLLSPSGLRNNTLMTPIWQVLQEAMGVRISSSATPQEKQQRHIVRRQALDIWILYTTALWRDWDMVKKGKKEDFLGTMVRYLPVPLHGYFSPAALGRPAPAGVRQQGLEALQPAVEQAGMAGILVARPAHGLEQH